MPVDETQDALVVRREIATTIRFQKAGPTRPAHTNSFDQSKGDAAHCFVKSMFCLRDHAGEKPKWAVKRYGY